MRTQYGNVTAAPVDVGRRVVARLIVGAFGLAANFIPAIAQGVGGANSSITIVSVVAVIALVVSLIIVGVNSARENSAQEPPTPATGSRRHMATQLPSTVESTTAGSDVTW